MKKDCKDKLTKQQLIEGTHHAMYELSMLAYCIKTRHAIELEMIKGPKKSLSQAKNLILEGFLIHARNLNDFLCTVKPSHKDDITVWHYVPKDKMPQELTSRLQIPGRKGINKQLAHITTKRKIVKDQSWNTLYIVKNLISGLIAFNAVVDQALLHEDWVRDFHGVVEELQVAICNTKKNIHDSTSATGYVSGDHPGITATQYPHASCFNSDED